MADPWDIDWSAPPALRTGPGPEDLQIPPDVQAQRDATRLQMLQAERQQVASNDPGASALDQEIDYAQRGIDFTGKQKTTPAAQAAPWEMDWGQQDDAQAAPGASPEASAAAPWEMQWGKPEPVTAHDPNNPDFQDIPSISDAAREIIKWPTKLVAEGAAFFGGAAPMAAGYTAYALNRVLGESPDDAIKAAMAARESTDPGAGLAKLADLAGVDKSWIQSDAAQGFMQELNEKWIQPASEKYFPAQQSLPKTMFEDLANIATFGAVAEGAHVAKAALPKGAEPTAETASATEAPAANAAPTEAPQPAAEAQPQPEAAPAPQEAVQPVPQGSPLTSDAAVQRAVDLTDETGIEHRARVVNGQWTAVPVEDAPIMPAADVLNADTVDGAIAAAQRAAEPPETPKPEPQETPNGYLDQTPTAIEDVAAQRVDATAGLRAGADDVQLAAQGAGGGASAFDAEVRDHRLEDAQPVGAENAAEVQGAGALDVGEQPGNGEAVGGGNARPLEAAGSGEAAGDHQPGAPEVDTAAMTPHELDLAAKLTRSPDRRAELQAQLEQNPVPEAPGRAAAEMSANEIDMASRLSRSPTKRNDLQRARANRVLPTDSLKTLLQKSGGIKATELTRDGADPKDVSTFMRFGAARKNGGMSLDGTAEVMASHGYDVYDEHGAIDATKARDILQRVVEGEDVYSPEGLVARAEAERAAREADLHPTDEDLREHGLGPEDTIDAGLVSRASEIDEGAVERLAIQYENDDAGFMRGVQEIVDGRSENADHATARGGEDAAAAQAPEGGEAAPDRESALARLKAAVDAVRAAKPGGSASLMGELDAARRSAEKSGASGVDLVNAMEGPQRPLGVERRLEILERGQPKEAKTETPPQGGVSASGRPAIEDVPPALLRRVKVSVDRLHEGEGVKSVEVAAHEALADHDAEISAFEKLLECVRAS